MPYKFRIQARKPLRLHGYDYSIPGYYFITLCTEGRLCLFGDIVDGIMHLNEAGCMIHSLCENLHDYLVHVEIDTLIVMPNHIHAIIVLLDTGPALMGTGPALMGTGPARRPAPTNSLPEVIRDIKSYTTHCYSKGVHEKGYLDFPKRLWQRSYHEHVIRNKKSLNQIRQYILNNPSEWARDRNNPNL